MEVIIDNVLCFLNSALSDYSQEKLADIVYSFYSHEDIKNAKEKICNILGKDIIARRDPDKKRKDLNDLLQSFIESKEKFKRNKYVADTYKKLPPIGMEYIAPLLINLTSEITRINELLPKILDIKTTVSNTADTVRDIKVDISQLKQIGDRFNNQSNCLTSTNKENTIKTFRQKGAENQSLSTEAANLTHTISNQQSSVNSIKQQIENQPSPEMKHTTSNIETSEVGQTPMLNGSPEESTSIESTDVSSPLPLTNRGSHPLNLSNDDDFSTRPSFSSTPTEYNEERRNGNGDSNLQGWTTVERRKKKTRGKIRYHSKSLVTGAKCSDDKFKAAERTCDLFIGKVAKNVDVASIKEYIEKNFTVKVLHIAILEIKTAYFNAFKVTLSTNDKEKLFKPDKWPKGVIVDKFYNRKSKNLSS